MFDLGKRYMTRRIADELPVLLKTTIWACIYALVSRDVKKVDYLQVFTLSIERDEKGKLLQVIKHTQEQPSYKKIHRIPTEKAITAKIFVIDSSEYSTILFAEEY